MLIVRPIVDDSFLKTVGFTSKVTVMELSGIINPAPRELSKKCRGTFQRSMCVSNLIGGASRIGSNITLVQTQTLYARHRHRSTIPFFTENQHEGQLHGSLWPPERTDSDRACGRGLHRCREKKLPAVIRASSPSITDAAKPGISTTHGATSIPTRKLPDEVFFTYRVPIRVRAGDIILMMADAIEAASRSPERTHSEAISALVQPASSTARSPKVC